MKTHNNQNDVDEDGYPSLLMMRANPVSMSQCFNGIFQAYIDGKLISHKEADVAFFKEEFTEIFLNWMGVGRERELNELLPLTERVIYYWKEQLEKVTISSNIANLISWGEAMMFALRHYLRRCELLRYRARIDGYNRKTWRQLLVIIYNTDGSILSTNLTQLPKPLNQRSVFKKIMDGLAKEGLIDELDGLLTDGGRVVARFLCQDHED